MKLDLRSVIFVDLNDVVVVNQRRPPVNSADEYILEQDDGKQIVDEYSYTRSPATANPQTPTQVRIHRDCCPGTATVIRLLSLIAIIVDCHIRVQH